MSYVVGRVIPDGYRTGSDGDIEAFCEHMLIFGPFRAKQGGAGPVLVITGPVPVKNMF